jgi:hypothetical protein
VRTGCDGALGLEGDAHVRRRPHVLRLATEARRQVACHHTTGPVTHPTLTSESSRRPQIVDQQNPTITAFSRPAT